MQNYIIYRYGYSTYACIREYIDTVYNASEANKNATKRLFFNNMFVCLCDGKIIKKLFAVMRVFIQHNLLMQQFIATKISTNRFIWLEFNIAK